MTQKKLGVLILIAILLAPLVLSQVARSQEVPVVHPVRVADLGITEEGDNPYMAHFISDDMVMVVSGHGDVDLGGRYVSATWGRIYIYKFEGGEWKRVVKLGSPGVFRIGTWEKIVSYGGFFSGDGRFLLMDMYTYKNESFVIDLTGVSNRTIDFSEVATTDFYPCQIDYSGDYICAGTTSGDIYVWKWDSSQNKYVLIWSYNIGGNIRRLHMTMDARWLVTGALNINYLFIFRRTGDTFELVNQIPLEDGVGALGITDPWNVGYIAVGGDTGWVYVFDAREDPANPKLIFKEKLGTGRFYNPFYDRFMPKNVIVLAFKQHAEWIFEGEQGAEATPAVIVDVISKKAFVFTERGKASAVSPSGTWVLLGDAIYMTVQTGIYTGASLQMDVSLNMPLLHHDSGEVMEYKAPEGLTVKFYTGDIKITSVTTLLRREELITDPVIAKAQFGEWYRRGWMDVLPVEEKAMAGLVTVRSSKLASINVLSPNEIEYAWSFFMRYYPYKNAWANGYVVFNIPLNVKLSPYDNITLVGSFRITSVSVTWSWKKDILGMLGLDLSAITGTKILAKSLLAGGLSASAKELMKEQIINALVATGVDYLKAGDIAHTAVEYASRQLASTALAGLRSSVATLVSYALIAFFVADFAVGTAWAKDIVGYTFYMVAPVFQDIQTGDKYIACYVLMPEEVSLDEVRSAYEKVFGGNGIKYIYLVKKPWGKTWEEYISLLKEGRIPPKINLYQLAQELGAYVGVPVDRLRLVSLKIGLESRVIGRVSLATAFSGLHSVMTVDVKGSKLQLWAEITGGKEYKNPEKIAQVVGYVTVNGVNYTLSPTEDGAVAHFNIPTGADKLEIVFPRVGLYLDGEIESKAKFIAPFEKVNEYEYYAEVHFNWESVQARIEKIELMNMPEPAVFIERVLSYRYGKDVKLCYLDTSIQGLEDLFKDTYEYQHWKRLGNMFNVYTIENTWYYETTKYCKWIDPFNGATLQPCKTWGFRYYTKLPPDVAIKVYFNGTNVVGTQPRHITFKVMSNVEQDEVRFHWKITLMKFDYKVHDWVAERVWEGDDKAKIKAINQYYDLRNLVADEYLGEAYKVAKEGYPVWLVIEANITYASGGNFFKANDYDKKAIPILQKIPPKVGENGTLTVVVFDMYNRVPISGATVTLRFKNDTLVGSGNTNASGMITFNIVLGETYKIEAEKSGYVPLVGNLTIAPLGNITVKYLMMPEGAGEVITPDDVRFKGNWTHAPYPIVAPNGTILWALAVQAIYNDSAPFEGALITIYEAGTTNIIYQDKTNGTGFAYFWIKDGTAIDIKCEATVNGTTYTFWRKNVVMDRSMWVVFTLPIESPLYTKEVGILWGEITIHRGQGYLFGNMSHCVRFLLWTNKPQTVNVTITIINAETNETVTSLTKTYDLFLGVNPIYEWFSINASQGMEVRAWINITAYEYDTDPNNNALLTKSVWLKPFLDLKVFILWQIVETQTDYAIIPGDVIEIAIGVQVPINITKVPMTLNITMDSIFLRSRKPMIRRIENITSYAGIVWRNYTVTLPWRRQIVVEVNATHPWEDMGLNNVAEVTIDIGANAKLESFDLPRTAIAGRKVTIKYRLISNLENEPVLLFLQDNTTSAVVFTKEITLIGNATVAVEFKAPENPTLFWVIQEPASEHKLQVGFSGYDSYAEDNIASATMTVVSRQALWTLFTIIMLIIFIVVIVAIIARASRALIPYRPRRYVKFKSF